MSRIETVKEYIQKIANTYTETKGQAEPELTVKDFLAKATLAEMMRPCDTARDFTGTVRCAERTKARFAKSPDYYIDRYLGVRRLHPDPDPLGLTARAAPYRERSNRMKLRKAEDQTRVALEYRESSEPCNSESEYAQKMDAIDRHYDQCFNTIIRGCYDDTPQFITDTLLTVYGCIE